jgi:hypothetical protein
MTVTVDWMILLFSIIVLNADSGGYYDDIQDLIWESI